MSVEVGELTNERGIVQDASDARPIGLDVIVNYMPHRLVRMYFANTLRTHCAKN